MKVIGLIGGMSWESTVEYYRLINEAVRDALGGLHSAKCVLYSVDFAEVADLQRLGQWAEATQLLVGAAQNVERAGADMVLICTNTMHKVADAVAQAISVPLLHIVDVVAAALQAQGLRSPLLLATRYTMEQDFWLGRMRDRHGLSPLVPASANDRGLVHTVIFDELCHGLVRDASRAAFCAVIESGKLAGADGVILGCTEIGMLIGPNDTELPIFDSTFLHADAALDLALAEPPD